MTASDKFIKQLISNTCHDLQSPTTVILGMTDLLMTGVRGPITSQQQDDLVAINSQAKFIAQFVKEVFYFYRIENGDLTITKTHQNIKTLLEQAIHINEMKAENEHITINFTCAIKKDLVLGDYESLLFVLNILITNAIAATQVSGHIDIHLIEKNKQFHLDIIDYGPPYSDHELSVLFEPFSPIKPRGRGRTSNIGLAICQKISHLHNGNLTCQRAHANDTVFQLTLPT